MVRRVRKLSISGKQEDGRLLLREYKLVQTSASSK